RHDLDAAAAALERSDKLFAELETTRLGAELAELRKDTRAQARWLERAVERTQGRDRARALLTLAQALSSDGSWGERADFEAREALALDPQLHEAEALLLERLEGSGRLADLAAYYEEAAAQTSVREDQVALLLRAADVYLERMDRPDAAAGA